MEGLKRALKYYLQGIGYLLTGQIGKAVDLAGKNPFGRKR